MEVNNYDPRCLEGIQELLREDMHPARQHDQVGSGITIEDLLRQCRIVLFSRLMHLLRVLLALGLKTVRDQVEVVARDGLGLRSFNGVGLAPVDDQADDGSIGDAAVGAGVTHSLEVGPVAAGHHQNATWFSHGGQGRKNWEVEWCKSVW